jgi:hypothetical protein
MRKYLFGILTGITGALVVKAAYAKGFKNGVKECSDKLDFIVAVQESKKDGES